MPWDHYAYNWSLYHLNQNILTTDLVITKIDLRAIHESLKFQTRPKCCDFQSTKLNPKIHLISKYHKPTKDGKLFKVWKYLFYFCVTVLSSLFCNCQSLQTT